MTGARESRMASMLAPLEGWERSTIMPRRFHFGDDLAAERGEAVVVGEALGLAGVGVGQLAVAVVGERHVPATAFVEFLHAFDIGADGVAVLNADDSGSGSPFCGWR